MTLVKEAHRGTLLGLLDAAFRSTVGGVDGKSAAQYAHLREIAAAVETAPAADTVAEHAARTARMQADAEAAVKEAADKAVAAFAEAHGITPPATGDVPA